MEMQAAATGTAEFWAALARADACCRITVDSAYAADAWPALRWRVTVERRRDRRAAAIVVEEACLASAVRAALAEAERREWVPRAAVVVPCS
jgi:hypothetical protein